MKKQYVLLSKVYLTHPISQEHFIMLCAISQSQEMQGKIQKRFCGFYRLIINAVKFCVGQRCLI